MKVVFTHTDFRIYWPARLNILHDFLEDKGIDLQVIEISGKGSPYSFSEENATRPPFWHCIFPEKRMEEVPARLANSSLCKKLDEIRPDIVFCGAVAFPSGAAGLKYSLRNKSKCIVFDDARLQDIPRNWYINYLKKLIYSAVDAILCPAPSWEETFRFFGFSEEQLFYGVNAVDNQFWSQPLDLINHGEDIPSEYIIAVGRQIPIKNFISLLRAYEIYISEAKNGPYMIFIGDGPDRVNLENYAVKNNLHKVRFKSFKTQEELRWWYKNAMSLVLPSYRETWGLVVNEAMASGLPVLVSNQAGCASTLVKEGVNGFTFPPDDINRLAELLLMITSMTEAERKIMGRKSLEIISQWGLEKFCTGAYEAIKYVSENRKRTPGILGKITINLWPGRYRPV